jgi:hypothetical protein
VTDKPRRGDKLRLPLASCDLNVCSCGTSGAVAIFDENHRTTLDQAQRLDIGTVSAFFPAAEGMWIGRQHGLYLVAGGRARKLSFAGDLTIEGISGILRMEDEVLWLNSLSGVLRVPGEEVEHSLKDSS